MDVTTDITTMGTMETTVNITNVINKHIMTLLGSIDLSSIDPAVKKALLKAILDQLYKSFNMTS